MANIIIEGDSTEIRNCKFAFKCPKFWSELKETASPEIRYCINCNENVYRCINDEDIAYAIRHNRCVAIMPYYDESEYEETALVGLIEPR